MTPSRETTRRNFLKFVSALPLVGLLFKSVPACESITAGTDWPDVSADILGQLTAIDEEFKRQQVVEILPLTKERFMNSPLELRADVIRRYAYPARAGMVYNYGHVRNDPFCDLDLYVECHDGVPVSICPF